MILVTNEGIWLIRGDDEALEVDLTVGDGEPYEMQPGDILTLTVRESPSRDDAILLQIDSAPGVNRIVIRHEDTAELEYGRYSADVQLHTADGLRKTVWPPLEPVASRTRPMNLRNFNLVSEVTMR